MPKLTYLLFVLLFTNTIFAQSLIPYKCGNKWGLATSKGKLIVPCQYDYVANELDYTGEFFKVGLLLKDGIRYGVINKKGELIIPISFELVGDYDDLFSVVLNGKAGLYFKNGKPFLACTFDNIENIIDNFLYKCVVRDSLEQETISFVDTTGKKYPFERMFVSKYKKLIGLNGNKSTIMNLNGEVQATAPYPIHPSVQLSTSFFLVEQHERLGIVDSNGQVLFEPQFRIPGFFEHSSGATMIFNEDYIQVKKDSLYGLIHRKTGSMDVPMISNSYWRRLKAFDNHYVAAKPTKESKWGLFHKGVQILDFDYDQFHSFGGTKFIYEKDGKSYFWDATTMKDSLLNEKIIAIFPSHIFASSENQEVLMNHQFKPLLSGKIEILSCTDSYLIAKWNDKVGILKNDKIVIPFEQDSIIYFPRAFFSGRNQNVFGLKKNGFWKIVQCKEDQIFCIMDKIDDLILSSSDLIPKQNKYFGFISDSTLVLPCQYDLDQSMNGVLKWHSKTKNKRYALLNHDVFFSYDAKTYKIISNKQKVDVYLLELVYHSLDFRGLSQKTKNGKLGLIDRNNKWVVPPKYDSFEFIDGEKNIIVSKNKKMGVIDFNHKLILPFKYDNIQKYIEGVYFSYSIEGAFFVKIGNEGFFVSEDGVEMIKR